MQFRQKSYGNRKWPGSTDARDNLSIAGSPNVTSPACVMCADWQPGIFQVVDEIQSMDPSMGRNLASNGSWGTG
jgi:hypothetical protein